MSIEVVTALSEVPAAEWNRLAGAHPFLRHEFLSALHDTGCASSETGWTPAYLVLRENGVLAGAMPLYAKTHSYGEYVFDWAWADAYARNGLHYYPKLLSAIPFTPVTGPRLLASDAAQRDQLATAALALARELNVSSLHCLFPPSDQADQLAAHGMLLRRGVQFHWRNAGYADFDAFLAALNHEKRKKIRQERRRVRDAGVRYEWIDGAAITDEHWQFFTRCYNRTYRAHRSSPYLNLEFFRRIGRAIPECLVLIVGLRGDTPVASSLNVHDGERLWGRYWGATEYLPALHFETCYYQVIEYCIARGISIFEGGAQGEHKMARGLMPVETRSAHWLAHPRFSSAIEEFLARESGGMVHYMDELNDRSPFRDTAGPPEK